MTDESQTRANPLPDDVVALVPMRNVVLFPHVLMPVTIGRPKSVAALEHALAHKTAIAIALQKDPKADDPGLDALCRVGTLANIVQHRAGEDGQIHAVCQGLQRVRIVGAGGGHRLPGRARRAHRRTVRRSRRRREALALQLRERGIEILSLLPGVPAELAHALQATRSPSQLADIAASLLDTESAEKQMLLETIATEERLTKVLQIRHASASRCCGCRRRSASAPRSSSTTASAASCCASS